MFGLCLGLRPVNVVFALLNFVLIFKAYCMRNVRALYSRPLRFHLLGASDGQSGILYGGQFLSDFSTVVLSHLCYLCRIEAVKCRLTSNHI
jgi:hypothetical protein